MLTNRTRFDVLKQKAFTAAFGTAGVIVSASAARLFKAQFNNTSATAYFVQVFNKAAAPAASDTPIWERRLPASGDVELDFSIIGLWCPTGIGIALSTTAGSLTLAGANNATAYVLHG